MFIRGSHLCLTSQCKKTQALHARLTKPLEFVSLLYMKTPIANKIVINYIDINNGMIMIQLQYLFFDVHVLYPHSAKTA